MRATLSQRFTALLVPPLCAACGERCAPGEMICAACETRIAALPLGRDDGTTRAAFPYAGPARDLVSALKFRGSVASAGTMARLMLPRMAGRLGPASVIVPAPAHPGRRRTRGFNQARLLADELARASGARVADCLVRAAGARPQSELSRSERLALAAGSIRMRAADVRHLRREALARGPTNVFVCDDVVTTGVTLEACAQAIREGQPEIVTGPIRAVVFASAGRRG